MQDELSELLQTAIYKEIASQAFYSAAQSKTSDPGAKALLKELAEEELRHSQVLMELTNRNRDWDMGNWHREKIADLMISNYLTGGDTIEEAGLQDTLIFAMKREQHAVEFYSRMMSVLRSEDAKRLCEMLVHEELKHKQGLEIFYDDLFYGED
jgi:rubrerythrin